MPGTGSDDPDYAGLCAVLPATSTSLPCCAVPRVRLDSLLADRGLFASRSRAAAAVLAGQVHLGAGRARASKPGQLVDEDIELSVDAPAEYVSRGGVKLANALDALDVPVDGRRALDVGASTGGFTDCLLQRGAAHVIALDVAYGELDWRIRQDSRVTVLERVNARALDADRLRRAPRRRAPRPPRAIGTGTGHAPPAGCRGGPGARRNTVTERSS